MQAQRKTGGEWRSVWCKLCRWGAGWEVDEEKRKSVQNDWLAIPISLSPTYLSFSTPAVQQHKYTSQDWKII